MKCRQYSSGVSISEVLIALGIFSTAVVGLFVAMNAINQGIAVSMRRDIEGAYANMLMSKINPYDQNVETAYDVGSTGCAGSRCFINIPITGNGSSAYEQAYYTMLVNSAADATVNDPATADVKLINLYFYRNATTTSPYRQFKREIAPDVSAWTMGGANAFYRDITGLLWTKINPATTYNTALGSVTPGLDSTDSPTGVSVVSTATAPTNIPAVDQSLWMYAVEPGPTGTKFCFDFPATEYRRYVVELGFNEFDTNVTASNQRVFDIYLNDVVVESAVDIYAAAGGKNKAVTKSYTVTPMIPASKVPTIKIKLQQNGGVAARLPRLSWIRIRRT